MSELRSAVESLRSETLAQLPDARIVEDLTELHRVGEQLEAERLRRLAEFDRRRLFERDGHLSAAAWLATGLNIAWGSAREQLRTAQALEHMPKSCEALNAGDLSMSAIRVLVGARDADPAAFAGAERLLVEAARAHSIADLSRVAAFWRQGVERDHRLQGDDALRKRRRLHASVSFMGMVRVDGDLDPETGETLLTALRAVLDAESRSRREEDDRNPAQRRADALGEICRQWLDRADRPTVAGERPHVTVTVGAEVLRGGANTTPGAPTEATAPAATSESATTIEFGKTSELDHVGPVDPAVARLLACDASMMRVVMAGPSEPLDVGRRTPVVSPAIRRAVIVRDRHCGFPGCDRPQTWCDAHHVVHWADGGPTALGNLLLLCRRHHRLVHQRGGFRLELACNRPVFRRPDGSILEDRAPP
jgi:hypothetical protein